MMIHTVNASQRREASTDPLIENASVVTRDISGFEGCGLTVINPWDAT
jgi:hypothetical protein